ncbi:hypothetical protein ACTQWV_05865 [Collinsella sp. LCP19S3_C1]|uniref:hypothetical protein n=1 Tax=unclassified Collinsella TaxID=2637548 RepID=UPI003F89527F
MAKVAPRSARPFDRRETSLKSFKKDFPEHTSLCYSAAQQQLGATAPWHHERSHQHEEHDDVSQQLVVA